MKKLVLLTLSTALIAACGNSSSDKSNAVDSDLKAEVEALKQDIYGGIVGNCPKTDWIATLDDYKKTLEGLPAADLDPEEWHKANGERDGVMTTTSGLQYSVVKSGDESDPSPYPRDKIMVNYHGIFPNGDLFDSAYERGDPAEFQANQVISGWIEALGDMKPCEARTLYIPGILAYGPQGRKNADGTYAIPPNATLLFHVQLLRIKRPALVQK